MSELEQKANDLCPMCGGSGKHDLRPPKGRVYEMIVQNASRENGGARVIVDTESLMQKVNDLASRGYEIVQMIPNSSGSMVAIMKWRWP